MLTEVIGNVLKHYNNSVNLYTHKNPIKLHEITLQ